MTSYTVSHVSQEEITANSTLFYDEGPENMTCVNRKKASFLIFTALPSIPIVVNIVVLVAVALDNRRLLRQNRVYAHVSSTLAANVIFAVFGILQIFSLYFNFEGHYTDPRPGYQAAVKKELARWWSFRKAVLYGMYIIMCGNIGLLIEAIRSSTCQALRSAAGAIRFRSEKSGRKWKKQSSFMRSRQLSSNTHDTAVPSSRVAKRRRSYISIILLWTLSLVYVIIPSIGWSCAFTCPCLSSCFQEEDIQNPPVRGCSRAFPPMSNSWLAVTIGIWAVCLLGAFVLLRRSAVVLERAIRKHRPEDPNAVFYEANPESDESKPSATACRAKVNFSVEDEVFESQLVGCDKGMVVRKIESPTSDVNGTGKTGYRSRSTASTGSFFSGIFSSEKRSLTSKRNRSLSQSSARAVDVKSSLRYVIWLTVLYAVFTAPPMIYLAADMAFANMQMNMVVMNACLAFPYIYCLICPILLTKCLPGLKRSIVNLFLRCCTTTSFRPR